MYVNRSRCDRCTIWWADSRIVYSAIEDTFHRLQAIFWLFTRILGTPKPSPDMNNIAAIEIDRAGLFTVLQVSKKSLISGTKAAARFTVFEDNRSQTDNAHRTSLHQ